MWKTWIERCLTSLRTGLRTSVLVQFENDPLERVAQPLRFERSERRKSGWAARLHATRHVTDPQLKVTKRDGGQRWRTL